MKNLTSDTNGNATLCKCSSKCSVLIHWWINFSNFMMEVCKLCEKVHWQRVNRKNHFDHDGCDNFSGLMYILCAVG